MVCAVKTKIRSFIWFFGLSIMSPTWALYANDITNPGNQEQLKINTIQDIKSALLPQIQKYCAQGCELIRIDVDIKDEVSEYTELGFEAIAGSGAQPRLFVDRATAYIQIDDNITATNRDRLKGILLNHLRGFALNAEIVWQPVTLPNIGSASGSAVSLQKQLEQQIESAINRNIQTYCPEKCLLAFVGAKGVLVNSDEASLLTPNQVVRDTSGKSAMRIESVTVEVAVDESLDEVSRERILNIMRANTRFAAPVNIAFSVSKFPESYSEKNKKENDPDPYGLEKLRQMLIMFRDLASTKEIITTTNSSSKSDSVEKNSSDSTQETSLSSKEIESSLSKSAILDSKQSYAEGGIFSEDNYIIWAGLGVALLMVVFLLVRFSQANKDAKMMLMHANTAGMPDMGALPGSAGQNIERYDDHGRPIYASAISGVDSKEAALKLKVENLKQTLIQHFMTEPRVAKETFSRMLKEDGVELTAKYLHIFGHMIVLEIIDDPNLSRDLYALSEFFHKSKIQLNLEEELQLLLDLKSRQTASEIKVLTSHGSDKFQFLERLDPQQIFTLISEEKAQVQSIVLTQLDKKRRMAVFDMYQGASRIQLMNDLCRADAIPKEFLFNVAKALHKKVHSRPEFDTENIRSSEIIMDLLERSSIDEQRQIMSHLQRQNPDTARSILMKLVTLEIIPYLKDGHLLEIILGMEAEDIVTFLAGTEEHIRNLFLSKAPYELGQSWVEELQSINAVDENNYKLVELKLFNRLRSLGNSGTISILDINEMIFAPSNNEQIQEYVGDLSRSSEAA